MKLALILVMATLSMAATAFAQAPNTGTSPGPHDPNPPMESPDLRLPAPCAPLPGMATASAVAKPGVTQPANVSAGAIVPVDSTGDTQCAANGVAQSAALPGLTSAPQ